MATKKQRRRRAKEHRHEWETVYLDAEGNEIEAPDEQVADTNGRSGTTKKAASASAGQRVVQPPSWRRVLKRGLLFAPAMFLLMTFLEPDTTYLERAFFTLQLLVIFLPFSYVMDRMTYRMWQKRLARERPGGTAPAKSR